MLGSMAFSHYFFCLFVLGKKTTGELRVTFALEGQTISLLSFKSQLLPFDREKAIGPFWQLALG